MNFTNSVRFDRLDGIELIRHRRRGTGQIEDASDLDGQRMHDVVSDEFEPRMTDQVRDIGFATGEEVVDANHFVPAFDQTIAQMASQESGTAGDENRLHFKCSTIKHVENQTTIS